MANALYNPLTWVNDAAPALSAANLQGHDNVLAHASAGLPTHLVYQHEGKTIARRADGAVLSSMATSSANNPAVIQAAIDDAATAPVAGEHVPGARVHIARGQYVMDSGIVAAYGVALSGDYGGWYDQWASAGTFGTLLTGTAGLAVPLVTVGVSGSGLRLADNPHGLWIESLLLDCTAAPTQNCITITDTAFVMVSRCFIRGGNYGIHITGTSGPFVGAYDIDIYDCVIKSCTTGVRVSLLSGSSTGTDGMIRGCRIMSSSSHQVHIDYGGWQISDCHFTFGQSAHHIHAENVDAIQISDNYLDSGTIAGIYLKSAGASTIVGNHFVNDAAFTDPTGAIISIPWGKCTVTGNILVSKADTTGLKGFVSTGDQTKGVIVGNVARLRASSTGWVAPVVDGSGVTVATRDDAASYIAGNVAYTDA